LLNKTPILVRDDRITRSGRFFQGVYASDDGCVIREVIIRNSVGEDLKAELTDSSRRQKFPRHTCNMIPPKEKTSLSLLGRTGDPSSRSPSSSGAIHRKLPLRFEVQEAWEMLAASEYTRERPKSARQAVPSPWMSTLG
jgi:hypothetical protein